MLVAGADDFVPLVHLRLELLDLHGLLDVVLYHVVETLQVILVQSGGHGQLLYALLRVKHLHLHVGVRLREVVDELHLLLRGQIDGGLADVKVQSAIATRITPARGRVKRAQAPSGLTRGRHLVVSPSRAL